VSEVYVFAAELKSHMGRPFNGQPVTRTLALPANKTLVALHQLIREAFAWDLGHLYSFWLDGTFWGAKESEYSAPFELGERDAKSAHVRIDRLGLKPGQRIAYIYDFGDEWRVSLTLRELHEEGETGILEHHGEAPPSTPTTKTRSRQP
jgi:hypothetical protein